MRAPASIRWFSALAAVVASALLVAPPVSAHSDGPSLRSVAAASTVHARQTSERQVAARMQSSGQPTLAPAPWPWRSVSIDTDDLSTDGVPDNAQIWPWAQTRYDVQTGEATWAVFLYGNPSKNVAYVGYLGHLVGTTCSTRILLVHDDAETGWATSADKFAKTRAATATLHSGGTSAMSWVTMDATTSMRNGSIDCAFARTYSADLGQVYQDTGWMKLNIPKRPKPQLKVTAPTGRLLNPGQRKKITVKVANPTAVPAPSAALRITGGKPSRGRIGLGTIPAHSSRVAHVKVKLRGHHTKVHLSASASGAKTVKRTVLLAAPIRLKKGDSLAGRYFWHTQTSTYEGWDNYGLAFVSSRWAYVGFPQKGLPHCHRQSSVHGDAGCVEYTWNKRTHKLRVGHLRGKFRPGHALVLLEAVLLYQQLYGAPPEAKPLQVRAPMFVPGSKFAPPAPVSASIPAAFSPRLFSSGFPRG